MATTNSLAALMFGHDDDTFYFADLSVGVEAIDSLNAEIPETFVASGWLDDTGLGINPSDSVTKITGHQGGKPVVISMETSETTLAIRTLESKPFLFEKVWSAVGERIAGAGEDPATAKYTIPRARKIEHLCGVWDAYNTAGGGGKIRIVFPMLALGERSESSMTRTDIWGSPMSLELLEDAVMYTDIPSLIPAA